MREENSQHISGGKANDLPGQYDSVLTEDFKDDDQVYYIKTTMDIVELLAQ